MKGQKIFIIIFLLLIVVYLMVTNIFISKQEHSASVKGVHINVLNPSPLFVREKDITAIFSGENIKWKSIDSLKKQEIEKEIKKNKYIEDVQVFCSVDKHYTVEITQRKPVLRVKSSDTSFFLDKNGIVLPTGTKYASEVHLYRGNIEKKFAKKKLLLFQKFLDENDYWAEMIDYIYVEGSELELYLRLKSGKIKFGKVENIAQKFDKLQLFINKIGKYKGLENYKTIDLRFDNQIVCAKNK